MAEDKAEAKSMIKESAARMKKARELLSKLKSVKKRLIFEPVTSPAGAYVGAVVVQKSWINPRQYKVIAVYTKGGEPKLRYVDKYGALATISNALEDGQEPRFDDKGE